MDASSLMSPHKDYKVTQKCCRFGYFHTFTVRIDQLVYKACFSHEFLHRVRTQYVTYLIFNRKRKSGQGQGEAF